MPHALTNLHKEYLSYLEDYIREKQESPSLKEIADHFGVTSPTVHNTLKSLQHKGFIHFMRHPEGFFIRLVERGGMREKIFPLFIAGKINQYGEVIDLINVPSPKELSNTGKLEESELPEYITIIQKCADPSSIFGLRATQRIPQAGIEAGDILIMDTEKKSQHGFMSILPVGPEGSLFLCWAHGKTYDEEITSFVMREPYPLPEQSVNWDLKQKLFWSVVAWDEDTDEYFVQLGKRGGFPEAPIPMNLVGATVLELVREY